MTHTMTLKKIALITGAAALFGGCEFFGKRSVDVELQASPTPYSSPATQGSPSTNGSMGGSTYKLQGGTATNVQGATDDNTLNKELNDVNVNSKLEMMVE